MNQEENAQDAPVVAPKQDPSTKLDPSKPLTQQTGKLLKIMENMPERKDGSTEEKKEEVKPVEEPKQPETHVEVDEEDELPEVAAFDTDLNQYFANANKEGKLQPITAHGKIGDDLKSVSVYNETELPEGFTFVSDAARISFERALIRLENEANALKADFERKQSENRQQIEYREFMIQDAKDVDRDRKWLQANNILPKFQYGEDDPKFNSDPAVKEANEIYDLYKKVNDEYRSKSTSGRDFRRISYIDAADKYYAHKARTAPKEQPKTQIQQQRNNVARKTTAPAGGDGNTLKPRAYAGMTFADVNRLARAGKI
jgi:hypothetical protein